MFDAHRGLLVPDRLRVRNSDPLPDVDPANMMATYVSLDEYAPNVSVQVIQDRFHRYPSITQLEALAMLNRIAADRELSEEWGSTFQQTLQPELGQKLGEILATNKGSHVLLARQVILRAMLDVLQDEPEDVSTTQEVPLAHLLTVATLEVHEVANRLPQVGTTGQMPSNDRQDEQILGVPFRLALELMQNQIFNVPTDPYSLVGRMVHIWSRSDSLVRTTIRKAPRELLLEATALEFEDFLALGFALYAHARSWRPGESLWLKADFNSSLPQEKIAKFVSLVSAALDQYRPAVAKMQSDWDFLFLQSKPVLRYQDSLLVLDPQFLLERVLLGIYWDVHDHERDVQALVSRSRARLQWTQAYSEMVEQQVVDHLNRIAPPILFQSQGLQRAFYSEDDLRTAYPQQGQKLADGALHFGGDLCLFEVVSGQVKTAFRIGGERHAFEEDVDRLVLEKAEQLDGAAQAILENEHALTNHPPTPGLRILPVIVVASGFPMNPASLHFLESKLSERSLLQDPRIQPLVVIDLSELEMLEALHEHGMSLVDVLMDWIQSENWGAPLGVYLQHLHKQPYSYFRPAHLDTIAHSALMDAIERLQLRT